MPNVAIIDGESEHTGSTVVGPVTGTLTEGSNDFVTISGVLVMVEDGKMEIPSHQYNLVPPLFHSHSFSPDTLAQDFVTVEGKKIILVGDNYGGDATEVSDPGSNDFVTI